MSKKSETLVISAAALAIYEATNVVPPESAKPSADLLDRVSTVNGSATAFTTSAREIFRVALEAETELSHAGLSNRDRVGVKVQHRKAGPTAKAYGHTAKGTMITLLRRSSGWVLTQIEEARVHPKQGEFLHLTISESQADIIRKVSLRPFVVSSGIPAPIAQAA